MDKRKCPFTTSKMDWKKSDGKLK